MKRNELTEIKGLDLKTLRARTASLKEEIAGLVMDKNMRKLKDLKMISKKRKDLAQILTIAKQKELLERLEAKLPNKKEAKI